jgi:hypothetical protein
MTSSASYATEAGVLVDLLNALTLHQLIVAAFALGMLLGMVVGAVMAVVAVGADIGRMAE